MTWSKAARDAAIASRRAKAKGKTAHSAAVKQAASQWVVANPGGGTRIIQGQNIQEAVQRHYRSAGYGVNVSQTGRITRAVPVATGSQTAIEHLGTIAGTPIEDKPRPSAPPRRSTPRKRSELEKPIAQRDPAKMMAEIKRTLERARRGR